MAIQNKIQRTNVLTMKIQTNKPTIQILKTLTATTAEKMVIYTKTKTNHGLALINSRTNLAAKNGINTYETKAGCPTKQVRQQQTTKRMILVH